MLVERPADGGGDLRLDPPARVAALVDQRQGIALALALDFGDRPSIGRSAPHRASRTWQGCADRAAMLAPSSVSASDRSLSMLRSWTSSNSTAATPPSSIRLQRDRQTMGHGDDPRRLARLAVEPGRIADRRARLFAALARHIFGRASGREASWHQQQDLPAFDPWLSEQCWCDTGSLAGARRRNQQRARGPLRSASSSCGRMSSIGSSTRHGCRLCQIADLGQSPVLAHQRAAPSFSITVTALPELPARSDCGVTMMMLPGRSTVWTACLKSQAHRSDRLRPAQPPSRRRRQKIGA